MGFFHDQERKLYRNLIFVQMLLHEVEHMEQYRKVKSDLLDFESKLLRLCYDPTLYYEMHQFYLILNLKRSIILKIRVNELHKFVLINVY